MKKAEKIELTFLEKKRLNHDTFTFYFLKPKNFKFKVGQYLKINLSLKNPDDRGSSRYFTISSSPTDKFISITTRIIKSSFKIEFGELKKGEKVNVFGPLGYFDFDFKDNREQIFLAGGIGMTPVHSILNFVDSKKLKNKILAIISFPRLEDVIFYNELKEIELRNKNIRIIYTLTREKKKNEGFEIGHIDKKLIERYSEEIRKIKFFAIGSESFEFEMFEMLKKMGVKEDNIFKENFPGY